MFQLVLEVLADAVIELAGGLGIETLKHAVGRTRRSSPYLAAAGHFLLGLAAGAVSLLVVHRSLVPPGPLPGLSLIVSPLVTGLVMQTIGDMVAHRDGDRPVLFSFRAGAIFAFGMALVRFAYLVLEITPFN